MKIFSYVIFVFLSVATVGFPADAPATSEQCVELGRVLADMDQQVAAIKQHLEKLDSALKGGQEASKAFNDQYDMLRLVLETTPAASQSPRWRAGVLGEIAVNRQYLAANEQLVGGIFNAIAVVRSALSQKSKEFADKQKEYAARCKPAAAP